MDSGLTPLPQQHKSRRANYCFTFAVGKSARRRAEVRGRRAEAIHQSGNGTFAAARAKEVDDAVTTSAIPANQRLALNVRVAV